MCTLMILSSLYRFVPPDFLHVLPCLGLGFDLTLSLAWLGALLGIPGTN